MLDAMFGRRRRNRRLGEVIDERTEYPKGSYCSPFRVSVEQSRVPNSDVHAVARDPSTNHEIGRLSASVGRRSLDVFHARVENPSCGIGTRLYEAMAREACNRSVSLRSDEKSDLSNFSLPFWQKQVRRKRARFDRRSERFVLKRCETSLEGKKRR